MASQLCSKLYISNLSLQCTLELHVDIGDKLKGISTIPSSHILVTAQIPNLVCLDRPNSSMYI